MKCSLLLFVTICSLLCAPGDTDIEFEGFSPETVYTYYTNGVNEYTQLTCVATSNTYTDINTTWIEVTGITYTDTGSSVLRFEDIATEVNWGDERDYLCRAVYQTDPVMYQDSVITVKIKYNTTITVSHGDITHIRDFTDKNNVCIPVMTENVMISCDANSALWNYHPTGVSPQSNVPNPATIDLVTLQYVITYFCTNTDINQYRAIVKYISLKAYGSGIYKKQQQQDTYTQLTEGESVYITDDTTLVCVSNIPRSSTWHYDNTNTGEERITEGTEVINSRGFLTLSLETTSRAGHYICRTREVTEDTYVTGNAIHSITVSVPVTTTTTHIPTTPIMTGTIYTTPTTTKSTTTSEIIVLQTTQSTTTTATTVSTELFYTPDYDNLFVGFDDVILTCVVIANSKQILNVSLVVANTSGILQSQFGSYETLVIYYNLELQTGTMNHRCTVVTGRGLVREDTVSVRVRDIYTQEVTNLHTELTPGGVNLVWETTYPRLANESFLLSVYDVSDDVTQVVTTQRLEYSLTDLSSSHNYSIRVQVVNRLNNTNNYTQISYTHTEVTANTLMNVVVFVVAGLLLFVVLLVSAVVVCCVVIVRVVLKSKKTNKYTYTKNIEDTTQPTNTSSSRTQDTKNYEPMSSVYPPHSEYLLMEVTIPHNYYEVAGSHLETERETTEMQGMRTWLVSFLLRETLR